MNGRLESIDVLRGCDMLFLMGLHWVIAALFDWNSAWWPARQMHHVAWQGFAQRDLVFPLFLFISGLTFPFSYAAQREKGLSTAAICGRIVRRWLTLTLLGLLCGGMLAKPFGEVCWGTVLGQIGFAWAVAALLYMFVGLRARIVLMLALLVGYTVILRIFVAPDHPGLSPFSPEANFAGWLDRTVFPNAATHYYQQGICAHVSAIVTATFGVWTGEFVRSKRFGGDVKALALAAAGIVLATAGYSVDAFGIVPVVKKMWTPSFVLVAGGWSLFPFAIFYWLIDVRGWWKRTVAFRAVGMNAITIYLVAQFVNLFKLAQRFTSPFYAYGSKYWGDLASSVVALALAWSLLWFLHRKKIYLKV